MSDIKRDDILILIDGVNRIFENRILHALYDFGDNYLMVLDSKRKLDGDFLIDPYYLVNKKTLTLSEFSPGSNIQKFKKAVSSKPLYERGNGDD